MNIACEKTNNRIPPIGLFLFVFMVVEISLFSIFFPHKVLAQNLTDGKYEWGIRSYDEELPRHMALTKQLEKETAVFSQRYSNTTAKLSEYLAAMDFDERDRIEKAYKARHLAGPAMGDGRLQFHKKAYDEARKAVLVLPAVDISSDNPVSMSARGQAWGTHIRYLKTRKQYFRLRAVIEEEKSQFCQSHMTNSLSNFLGVDLDYFVNNSLDAAWYIVKQHGPAFFDNLGKCAAEEITHIFKQNLLFPGRYSVSQRPLPTIKTTGPVLDIKSGAVACLTGALRDSLVHAMENAIRINFIQDMKNEGIPFNIADYWWKKYVIKNEKSEPENKNLEDTIAESINIGIQKNLSRMFSLSQVKKSLVAETDRLVRVRIRKEAIQQIKNDHLQGIRKLGSKPMSAARKRQFRKRSADRVRSIADKKLKKNTQIKFLNHLDYIIMLLQQGRVYQVRSGQVADFKKSAAPLIREYRRICTCLDKKAMIKSNYKPLANTDGAVEAIFKMGQEERKKFFSQCDAVEVDEHQLLSLRLVREIRSLHETARVAVGGLTQICPEGSALIKTTLSTMEGIKALAKPLLNDMKEAAGRLPEAQIALDQLIKTGNESADLGLKVVEAKHEAGNEAKNVCRAKSAFSASIDADAREKARQEGKTAVSKARDAVFRAKQAYLQAAALRDRAMTDSSGSSSAIIKNITALTGRLAEIKGKIAQIQVSDGRLAQLATLAENSLYDLNSARERTKTLLQETSVLINSKNQDIRKSYNEIRELGWIIVGNRGGSDKRTAGLGIEYNDCPINMRTHTDRLALKLNILKLTHAALAEAEANLPDNTDFSSLKERYDQAAADIISAVDVAEIFAEAAETAGIDAENCLNSLLAQDLKIKSKAAAGKEVDEDVPAFVTNSSDVDEDIPAFVINSSDSAPGSVNKAVKTTPKKSVSDLYKTKTGWRDNIVDQSVKMDEKTKKTFKSVTGGKTNKKPQKKTGGAGLLGVELQTIHSGGDD